MSAERTRVGVIFNGVPQYFQRDREEKRGGKFVAVPFFVIDTSQAATMSEIAAKSFVSRLRSLGVNNAWIEDCIDGRRIEFTGESVQSGEDNRTAVVATLDDENSPQALWYVVKPANTPNGAKWFLKIDLPGIETQVVYADDALGVLQRAADLDYLKYAVTYDHKRPQPLSVRTYLQTLSFATEIPLWSKYCAAADFFSRFEEFLRKDSNPLKIKNWRRGVLSEHPKKFSVVMVKRKPNRINGRFDEKLFCQCHWEI
jgi:hypothetical protein